MKNVSRGNIVALWRPRLAVLVVVPVAVLGLTLAGSAPQGPTTAAVAHAELGSPIAVAEVSCSAPAWNPSAIYNQGTIVSNNGKQWSANHWMWPGVEPGVSGAPPFWVPWADLGPCGPGTTTTTTTPGSTTTTTAPTSPTQPQQPATGPGGADYPHGDWIVSSGGTGNDAWYVFQPTNPKPASAPVAIMLHGYEEYSGYESMYQYIRHTVRQGNIVIYPRWQTGLTSPCLGPLDIEPCMTSAVNGIRGGMAWLQADAANRVQPQLDKVAYFGFSFGGIITANIANRHASLNLPTPRVLFLDEPHDGLSEATLDDSLSGIPSTVKMNCMVSDDVTAGSASGCKTMWPLLGHVPAANKDYVIVYDDAWGDPALVAEHGVSSSNSTGAGLNSIDYYAVWKIFDSLRSCAYTGADCAYGLGDTPQHRSMGLWSDGRPVHELAISDTVINP